MDIEILLFLQSVRTILGTGVERALYLLSKFATSGAVYIASAGIYWCIDKELGRNLLLNIAGGMFVNQFLKNTFCVHRPWMRGARLSPSALALKDAAGYSFPSGHTALAVAAYGTLARTKQKQRAFSVFCAALILLVAFSRLYLGCHTPQDVLCSLAVGWMLLLLNDKIAWWMDEKEHRDFVIATVGLIGTGLFLLYVTQKSYPAADGAILSTQSDCFTAAGILSGFCASLPLERRFVRFSVDCASPLLLPRFLVGAAILLALTAAKAPICALLGAHWGRFLLYFFLALVAYVAYPAIFTHFEKMMRKQHK
ncbi:MAG: phosphatase PAP2 family protein [Christensenellales bacterium]|jgi:membrane-associated phospholipid phosphatase